MDPGLRSTPGEAESRVCDLGAERPDQQGQASRRALSPRASSLSAGRRPGVALWRTLHLLASWPVDPLPRYS